MNCAKVGKTDVLSTREGPSSVHPSAGRSGKGHRAPHCG